MLTGCGRATSAPRLAAAALLPPLAPRHAQVLACSCMAWMLLSGITGQQLYVLLRPPNCCSLLGVSFFLPAASAAACSDKETPGYTCAQQKHFGQCNADWMQQGSYCANTCGRCPAAKPAPRPAGASLCIGAA